MGRLRLGVPYGLLPVGLLSSYAKQQKENSPPEPVIRLVRSQRAGNIDEDDEEQGAKGGVHPILKVDAIRFLYTFRNQLTKQQLLAVLPLLIKALDDSENYVTYTYAAIAIEKVLGIRQNGQILFAQADVRDFAPQLLGVLMSKIERAGTPEKIAENDHLMKAAMRVIITARQTLIPTYQQLLNRLVAVLGVISKNASNPKFDQYIFESLSALMRFVTSGSPTTIPTFESTLFEPFTIILMQDIDPRLIKRYFLLGHDELIPREGKDEAYDEVMTEIEELEEGLEEALKKFEKSLGMKLSWWHSAVGTEEIYMIETSAGQKNIPKEWTRNGGTKVEAREKRNTAIKKFKFRIYNEFDEDRGIWLRAIRVFAKLDCLFSLAKSSAAIGEPSCRPKFVGEEEGDGSAWFDFKSLRHPTLCVNGSVEDFIPNDVKLGGDVGKIALLTAENGLFTGLLSTMSGCTPPV
ncbi:hypothetical protein D9757_013744 [Collybiopsis confluens]|uniref:DNA mismatch repair protein MutS core domain-containing protein n=1 Tax=Collybiopsis confluens TaxID=2823264 RepID=A0A8H5CUA9_9AGAR|nr:hypothetical protein D9757_013744 [Collybiopsis confluens]